MQFFSTKGKEVVRAKADLAGEGVTGGAEFVEYEFGTQRIVKVVVKLSGDPTKLAPGLHAVHIHEKGSCGGVFKCAGGHFDPGPAGNSDPDVNHPFHAGDLPNIVIDETGKGTLEAVSTSVRLSGDDPRSILVGEGTALMIHGNPDPERGGPSGSGVSGGPRIACGVIRKA